MSKFISFCWLLFILPVFSQTVRKNGMIVHPENGWMSTYDSIMRKYFFPDNGECETYFETWKFGKAGICDSIGKVIFPNEYSGIHAPFSNGFSDMPLFFYIANFKHKLGLADRYGKTIISPAFDRLRYCHIDPDSCKTWKNIYVVAEMVTRKKSRALAINLQTGIKSGIYDEIEPYEHSFIFRNKKGWGVLDSNFRELYSGQRGEPYYFKKNYHGLSNINRIENYRTDTYDGETAEERCINNEVLLYKEEPEPESTRALYGMLNLRTGKTLPAVYFKISFKTDGNQKYYWCTKTSTISGKQEIDVLDSSFQLINTLYFFEEEENVWMVEYAEIVRSDYFIIFQDTLKKYGALNAKGETIIPFAHDSIYILGGIVSNQLPKFYCYVKDGLSAMFDFHGEMQIPFYYNHIQLQNIESDYFLAKKEDSYTLLDSVFNTMISGCTAISTSGICSNLRTKYIMNYGGNHCTKVYYNSYSWIAEKAGYLYMYEKGKLHLLDSSMLDFKTDFVVIDAKCLIDRSGKVIATGRIIENRQGNYLVTSSLLPAGEHLVLLNHTGEVIWKQDVASHSFIGDILTIYLLSADGKSYDPQKKGKVNMKTGEWILKPQ